MADLFKNNTTLESLGMPVSGDDVMTSESSTSHLLSGHHRSVTSQNHTWVITDNQYMFANVNNIVYYSLLLPLGLLGNMFTLSAVIMVLRVKKSVPNMLIGVLATADLTSLLTCHVIALVSMTKSEYATSATVCRFQSVMMFTYFKMGFFTKTCISVDRFIALRYPLKYRVIVTPKKIIFITVFNVIFSAGSSALTWIVDPEYIMQLETWTMCTNDFSIFTHYKLSIVIGEGSVFILGVIMFFIGNITVVRVMLTISKKLKKLKAHSGGALRSLAISRLTTVSTASVGLGFTAIGAIEEENGSSLHEHNNNTKQPKNADLATPLSKRALKKMNSNELAKPTNYNASKEPETKLSKASMHSLSSGNILNGVYRSNRSKEEQDLPPDKRLSLPTHIQKSRENRQSIFKKMINASRRSVVSEKTNVQNRQKKELQFAKLVMVIVTVFVILWIPFMVSSL